MTAEKDPEVDQKEAELVSLAMDEARRRIKDGTASSAILQHFLKIGSSREKMEREKLTKESQLLTAKVSALESSMSAEKRYEEALAAMRRYSPSEN